jgi:RNA polymerase sigma factor (sigma-70 family)
MGQEAERVKFSKGGRPMVRHDDADGSLMALDQYMRQLRGICPLTDEEEKRLVLCVERGRAEASQVWPDKQVLEEAKQARDRLIEGFLRLVVCMARQYVGVCRGMDLLDVVQEGNEGLLKAIDRHESGKGYPLVAFVSRYVRGAILTALYRRDGMVRIDGVTLQSLRQLRLAEGRLVAALGREPHLQEIASEMGVGVDKVIDLLEVRERKQVASLQGMLAEARDEDEYHFVSLFAEAVAADRARQQELEDVVQEAFETALTPRQREVVQLRYGLEAQNHRGQSQQEVASCLGVTREGVRNIERSAKGRLSALLRPVMQCGQVSYTLRCTRHDDHYTAKEAMHRLGMASTTFYRQVYRGTIPGVRAEGRKDVWVFSQEVIDRLAQGDALPHVS